MAAENDSLTGDSALTSPACQPGTNPIDLAREMSSLAIVSHESNPSQLHLHLPHHEPLSLLNIPAELRRKILRELLSFDKAMTNQRVWTEPNLSNFHNGTELRPRWRHFSPFVFILCSGQVLSAETNFHAAILRCCKQLYYEGRYILRRENRFIGVEGFGLFPLEYTLRIAGQVPFWRISQFKMLYGTWPEIECNPNITLKISNIASIPTTAGFRDMLVFPVSCIGPICKAISYWCRDSSIGPHLQRLKSICISRAVSRHNVSIRRKAAETQQRAK